MDFAFTSYIMSYYIGMNGMMKNNFKRSREDYLN